ncbi:hypothetical protein KHQ82_03470 [Mycoplasmatota bacterium]|nr:hypothetical protein KHQ82_03470 [Mycoplasmatota bacterium]
MIMKMKKYLILTLAIVLGLTIPKAHAVPNSCSIEITDGTNTAYGDEELITNKDSVTLIYSCGGVGTVNYDVYKDGLFLGTSNASESYVYDISGLSDTGQIELYALATDDTGSLATKTVDLTIDRTPTDVVTSLAVSDDVGDITDSKTNSSTIDLTWVEPSNETPSYYKVYYRRGISNRVDVTNSAYVNIIGLSAGVDIGTDGLNLVDGVYTFSVSTIDAAGNESVLSNVTFEYDTDAPNNISSLVMKDSFDEVIPIDGIDNTDSINLSWQEPTGEDVDHYNIYVKEGNGLFVFKDNSTTSGKELSTSGLSDGKLTFKVTSVDFSGNESFGTQTYFTLDTVAPLFSITYDLGGDGVNTNIESQVINYAEKSTIDVVNSANDIVKYSITTGVANYKNGDYQELESAIKNVSSDGLYTVKVKDLAGNISSLSFTFDQVYPDIPSNRYIDVTSVDVEYRNGIQAVVTIAWDKSTDDTLDHYELWINGELYKDNIEQPLTGTTVEESYTLTTIKYGDVTNYYEVRTVDEVGNFGRYYERRHIVTDLVEPNAYIISTNSSDEEIFFTVYLEDRNRVIDRVYAVLYKNDIYQRKISLTSGTNEYSFSGLDRDSTDYKIKVEADYTFDGSNYDDKVINADTVYLLDTLDRFYDVSAQIVDANKSDTSIDLTINSVKDSTSNESIRVTLHDENGNPVDFEDVDLDTDDLTATSEVSFSPLIVGDTYQIRITENDAILATYNFSTEKDMPSSNFKINNVEQNTLDVSIIISDDDGSVTDLSVVLLEDGELVPNKSQSLHVGTNNVSFSGLDENSEYQFKVFASYNLMNGRGAVVDDVIGMYTLFTAKTVPTIKIDDIDVTGNSVTFDSNITDRDNAIVSVKAVLYDGNQSTGKELLLNKGILNNREFYGLDPVKDYRINIDIVYDLNDNNDPVTNPLFYGTEFRTLKVTPTVDVKDLNPTNVSVDFSAIVIDPNDAYINGFIKLYSTNSNIPIEMVAIGTTTLKNVTFEDLKPETTYRIKVDADIDIGDEDGEVDKIIYTTEFTTLPNIDVSMENVEKTTNSVHFDVDFINNIEARVVVRLKLEEDLLEEVLLEEGLNAIEFDNLLANTTYNILIEYMDGSGVLLQSQILTDRIISLTVPEVFIIQSSQSEENFVTLRVTIVDVDNTVDSDNAEIKICSDSGLCSVQETSLLNISEGVEVELPYQKNIITVSISYDAGDHTGTVSESTNTIEKIEPEDPNIVDPDEPEEPVNPNENPLFNDTTLVILVAVLAFSSVTALIYMIVSNRARK